MADTSTREARAAGSEHQAATGPDRIAAAFERAAAEDRAAVMPYMMGGFPDQDAAGGIARAYVEGGADLVELGVPFSDPLADGPVIHAAATRALAGGATLESVLETCAGISSQVPVVVMCYANMALAVGPGRFARALADAGAAGAIVPDLPLEEGSAMREELGAAGLAAIPLVAPTTPAERRRRICESATGFVYVVSTVGVTGERSELRSALTDLVGAVRAEADVPAAVGFGISTPEQVSAVSALADGVIVGSRLVREVQEAGSAGEAREAILSFLAAARDAARR